MSVNKSCDVISHQLFLHNEADKTTMIPQRKGEAEDGGGWRMCDRGRGDEGGESLMTRKRERERASCEVEAEMWRFKVVDDFFFSLNRGGERWVQI